MDRISNKKRVDFEIIRIIAILFVMINHTSTNGFVREKVHENSIMYVAFLAIASLARVAVPLFFMISGALLVKKEESLKRVLVNRVAKYVVIILAFSIIQYVLMMYWGMEGYRVNNILEFFSKIYVKEFVTPYWFLYAYLGLMIMLPFLRKMVKNMSRSDFKYLIVLHVLFFGVFQVFEYFTGLGRINISIPFACETSIFYFILGYYADNYFIMRKKTALWLTVLAIISVAILTFMVYWKILINGDYMNLANYSYSSALIVFPTFLIFTFMKYFNNKINQESKLYKALVWIGGTTFSIYLLEGVFERLASDSYFLSLKLLPPIFSWLLWVGCSFVCGVLLVSVYKLIRKYAIKLSDFLKVSFRKA